MTDSERRLKTVFDWLGALVLVVALSPLLLLLALLIKLSGPGPVFFRQLRHGIGGESIEILKFRTMKLHREAPGQVTQATPNDHRVTAIGCFLRRSSLDELPRLFNVLKGEMSLGGPRPHAIEHNDVFKSQIPKYMLRRKVKPGITGWDTSAGSGVNGFRGQTETPEKIALRIQHDLRHIQNGSLWLDLEILLMMPRTMAFVLVRRNAY